MAFDRRDFMKLAGVCGMGVAMPHVARAQSSVLYEGPLFVMVNAGGGWDPTSLCDPKGQLSEAEEDPMNQSYFRDDIQTAGNIPFAPVGSNANFFNKYASQLLVLNGVDTKTNGHDSGSRHIWSGKLADGNPSFSALVAAEKSRSSPMAFLSNGGYDRTFGLVAPTRAGNTSVLERIAFPHRQDTDEEDSLYHTAPTVSRIQAAQLARLERQRAKMRLPKRQQAMDTLFTARAGQSEVRRLTEFLPNELDNSGNRLIRQSQLAIASYKAGITVSVNLNMGGFDTHGNHDQNHIPRLAQLLDGVDFFMEEAERQDVADRVVVVMSSDFGRTPGYNNGNGKDHWSITSYMLMGQGIRGNRVVGTTDDRHRAIGINTTTLEPDSNGTKIEPGHVHAELRQLAGVGDSEIAREFGITTPSLNLFS